MKMIPKNLNVEIKHSKDALGRKYVCLCACDSLGKVRYSRTYIHNQYAGTWHFLEDGKLTEVAQEHVYRDFLNTYKSLMSVEDLITGNLTVAEEGY